MVKIVKMVKMVKMVKIVKMVKMGIKILLGYFQEFNIPQCKIDQWSNGVNCVIRKAECIRSMIQF